MVFHEKIRTFLDSRNASQNWLAEQTGLSKSAVSDFFVKKSRPSAYRDVVALARLMNCDPAQLMDDSCPWPPPTVHRVPELSDEEMEILKIARRVGLDRAAARILLLPEPGHEAAREDARREEPAREVRATLREVPPSSLRPGDVRPAKGHRNG